MKDWRPACEIVDFPGAARPIPPIYPGSPYRSFSEAVSVCLERVATVSGRASRSEFWYFTLFSTLVRIATGYVDRKLHMSGSLQLLVLTSLALPQCTVLVRRLHDTGRSGWWASAYWFSDLAVAVGILRSWNLHVPGLMGASDLKLLLSCNFLLWVAIMAVFAMGRGDTGPNRFG